MQYIACIQFGRNSLQIFPPREIRKNEGCPFVVGDRNGYFSPVAIIPWPNSTSSDMWHKNHAPRGEEV